jgi:hypothetical protein
MNTRRNLGNLYSRVAHSLVRMRIEGVAALIGLMREQSDRPRLAPARVRSRREYQQFRRRE